jgi:hypothetical protein
MIHVCNNPKTRCSVAETTATDSSDKTTSQSGKSRKTIDYSQGPFGHGRPLAAPAAILALCAPFARFAVFAMVAILAPVSLIATVALTAVVAMVALRAHRKSVP